MLVLLTRGTPQERRGGFPEGNEYKYVTEPNTKGSNNYKYTGVRVEFGRK